MSLEKHAKKMYNRYGHVYQQTRDEKRPERLFNEYLEVPCMLKAVGNIKGKKLLDAGCGAGVHARKYVQKGAIVKGIDLSSTMLNLAKKRCPNVQFSEGNISKLPYTNNEFDIVTSSLVIDYVVDLQSTFREIHRVLKKGGLFFYSDVHPASGSREKIEDSNAIYHALGYVKNKKTGKVINLGSYWAEKINAFYMVPGMKVKWYKRQFRTHLKALIQNGFELIDFIDCKPVKTYKKYDPVTYELLIKVPAFCIYVCKKK